MNSKLNVIYEDNHIIVVVKPPNIPVQGDESGDFSLLDMVKEYIKIKYNKPGKVFAGLVHRLDRPVGGLMVFARTSKGASRLSETIRQRQFGKRYLAVLRGSLSVHQGTLLDYLVKDTKSNMVKVADAKTKDAKEAVLDYKVVGEKNGMSLVSIDLKTGRSHQIRVQFSSRGTPLYGDVRYGVEEKSWRGNIALWSGELSFPHPISKELLSFKLPPPDEYPWNLFKI